MINETQKKRAREFQALHRSGKLFVLGNAWNGGSARIMEARGIPALGTTSAGVAYSMGYADGEVIPLDDLFRVTKEIAGRVSIPLSVDMERGYGRTPKEVCGSVRRILEAGAVGINVEDGLADGSGLRSLEEQVEILRGLSALKRELDLNFVINARSCVFWLGVLSGEEAVEEAVRRSGAFREAGADCVFLPGALEKGTVEALMSRIEGPVNLIANPVYCPLKEMESLGVSRISLGSGPARMVFGTLDEAMASVTDSDDLTPLFGHSFSYPRAQEFFSKL